MRGRFWIIIGAGVLLLLGAALLSAFQGWGGRASTLLLGAGGAAWTLALLLSWRDLNAYLARRSARYGMNALVLSFLVVVILFLLGFLADRHGWRMDFTSNHEYSLSEKTLKVLQGLPKRIDVHVFYARTERDAVRDLLREYTRRSSLLRVHQDDLNRDPELAERYGVTALGVIVFDAGDKTERISALSEEDVTNALIQVSRPGRKKVYFLTEHGEKDITSKGVAGFAAAAAALQRENYSPQPLSLARGGGVPADCDVLVIAGPKSRLVDNERLAVQRYLESGRRVMLLFDPRFQCGLEEYLQNWGIQVGNDRIVDPSPTGQLMGRGPTTPLVNRYGVHPITKQFRLPTYFEVARSVRPSPTYAGRVQAAVLAFSSEQSWADGDLNAGQVRFGDPDDIAGPVPLAMAARLDLKGAQPEMESALSTSKPADAAVTPDALIAAGAVSSSEARLVVVGDSDFANNRNFADMGNGNFFLNCIAWLAQDEDLIAVRPRDPDLRRVSFTKAQLSVLDIVAFGVLPGLVALLGATIVLRRRASS
jgi:ABC-type uncharacterized transport system involved in gliding motility auxiliary subunit